MTGTENCDDPALTPSQQLLCHDDKKFHQTIVGGAVIGTLVGAAGGAATCALSGRKNILLCAGIGAGVGLFAGGVAGYVVAKQQAAATSHVRAIDGVTDDIRAENIALQKEVDAAQDVSTQDQAKLAQINAAVASGQLSADAARSQRSIIAQDSAHIQTIIDHLQQQQKNFAEAGQKINQPSRSYTKQMNELQDQIATLTQQKAALRRCCRWPDAKPCRPSAAKQAILPMVARGSGSLRRRRTRMRPGSKTFRCGISWPICRHSRRSCTGSSRLRKVG